MAFTNTVGGKDPWSMPSDGADLVRIRPSEKAWERRQYHKAARREVRDFVFSVGPCVPLAELERALDEFAREPLT